MQERTSIMADPTPGEHSGVAALSAAIVAAVISIFAIQGPYNDLGAIVALTLIFMIIGYVWKHPRTVWQSLAVASILGGVAIPIVGFILEMWFIPDRRSLL
jgi:hypothetical protein